MTKARSRSGSSAVLATGYRERAIANSLPASQWTESAYYDIIHVMDLATLSLSAVSDDGGSLLAPF
jgi:hypothetical protein